MLWRVMAFPLVTAAQSGAETAFRELKRSREDKGWTGREETFLLHSRLLDRVGGSPADVWGQQWGSFTLVHRLEL